MVSLTTATTVLNPKQKMTDFDYKKYSLENLENWIHDAISSAEATPQEIYDVIVGVVKETYYYHKDQASRADELLGLLNGRVYFNSDSAGNDIGDVDGLYITQSPFFCNSDDSSPECKGAWNDFWGNDSDKVDVNHSRHWYEYDRNDPNCENPFVDKVVKWQLPVQLDGLTGECYIELPDDLLEVAGLKEGDTVKWIDRGDGSFEMRKVNDPE
jgi:hypothetical protein